MKKLIIAMGIFAMFWTFGSARAQQVLPRFPGILSIPVKPDPQWSAFLREHQPVKIVFGVNDLHGQLQETLTNAALIVRDMKANKIKYKIQIVLYGNAVKAADAFDQKYSSFSGLMEALHQQGVAFRVCFNSLYSLRIDPGNVYGFMKVVPAGILQLAKAQMQGYSYISN